MANFPLIWTLTALEKNDARQYLDIIFTRAKFGKAQCIKYYDDNVFVISEEQYKNLKNKN